LLICQQRFLFNVFYFFNKNAFFLFLGSTTSGFRTSETGGRIPKKFLHFPKKCCLTPKNFLWLSFSHRAFNSFKCCIFL